MSDQNHKHSISFRLNDENLKKLELMAKTQGISKSELTRKIIEDKLTSSTSNTINNDIPYPRPILKTIFDILDESQKQIIILEINNYYDPFTKSEKFYHTPEQIVMLIAKWLQNAGCEVNVINFKLNKILTVHHEMNSNWSEITCVTVAHALQTLGYKIVRTFSEKNWFKVEFSEV